MRKLLLSVAAASLLAAPVFADGGPVAEPAPPPPPPPEEEPAPPPPPPPPPAPAHPSFYVEGTGGVAFAGDLEYGGTDFDMDTGWGAGGAAGIFLNPNWAVEVDVFYAQMGYDGFATHVSGLSTMVDVLYHFNSGFFADPYVGAGLGAVRVRYDGENQFPAFTGSAWKFGYQLMAGLMLNFSDNFGIFAEYRFHDAVGQPNIVCCDVEYQSHNASGGIRVSF